MQILKVERSDTSLIQGQFSNVWWRLGGGEKKMNIDLTLQLGKKPSHLTQKTPSFCWILLGEETSTLFNNQTSVKAT